MLTISHDQIAAIKARIQSHKTTHGVGDMEASCTVAHINIALSGRVKDECPPCMSKVLHRWIIPMQDAMPLDRLNGHRWQRLIPYAAGTGNDHEDERLTIIMDWMWGAVLPQLQPLADNHGFGSEWRAMTTERTEKAAAWAAWAAAEAARAADSAEAAAEAAAEADSAGFWDAIDPEALLERLILVSVTPDEMGGAQ